MNHDIISYFRYSIFSLDFTGAPFWIINALNRLGRRPCFSARERDATRVGLLLREVTIAQLVDPLGGLYMFLSSRYRKKYRKNMIPLMGFDREDGKVGTTLPIFFSRCPCWWKMVQPADPAGAVVRQLLEDVGLGDRRPTAEMVLEYRTTWRLYGD